MGRSAASALVLLTLSACVAPMLYDDSEEVAELNLRVNRSLLSAATGAERMTDYQAAAVYYGKLYERDTDNIEVIVGLARSLRSLRRAREAEGYINKAMVKTKKDPRLLAELGKAQLALNQPLKAIETLSQADTLERDNWTTILALAVAFDRVEMYDQADRYYDRANDLSPENVDVLNNRALSLAQRKKLKEAIELLERASGLPEATVKVRQNLAMLYAMDGQLKKTERLVYNDLSAEVAEENIAFYRDMVRRRDQDPDGVPGASVIGGGDMVVDAEIGELVPIEAIYLATREAAVRSRPKAGAKRLGVIAGGGRIHVSARTADGSWFLVEPEGGAVGFVFARLLTPLESAAPAVASSPVRPVEATPAPAPAMVAKPPSGETEAAAEAATGGGKARIISAQILSEIRREVGKEGTVEHKFGKTTIKSPSGEIVPQPAMKAEPASAPKPAPETKAETAPEPKVEAPPAPKPEARVVEPKPAPKSAPLAEMPKAPAMAAPRPKSKPAALAIAKKPAPKPASTPTKLAVVMPAPRPAATLKTVTPKTVTPLAPPAARRGDPGRAVGASFRDCETCPEMILLPAGRFQMGSPEDEARRRGREGPRHAVAIGRLLVVGKYEISFLEWDLCVLDGGCTNRPDDQKWGRERRPVINVSWFDAQEFVNWLSRRTGQRYRLLSEAEWEYAARAGSASAYHQGAKITPTQAHFSAVGSGGYRDRSAPVGGYPPNLYGLHDMHGNVREWTADCRHDDYRGAPTSGRAWLDGGECELRIIRGGSWGDRAAFLRSAVRNWTKATNRSYVVGFRVARDLAEGE